MGIIWDYLVGIRTRSMVCSNTSVGRVASTGGQSLPIAWSQPLPPDQWPLHSSPHLRSSSCESEHHCLPGRGRGREGGGERGGGGKEGEEGGKERKQPINFISS